MNHDCHYACDLQHLETTTNNILKQVVGQPQSLISSIYCQASQQQYRDRIRLITPKTTCYLIMTKGCCCKRMVTNNYITSENHISSRGSQRFIA